MAVVAFLRKHAWVAVPLALALAMRLLFHVGFQAGDDLNYGRAADALRHGAYEFHPDHQALRLGLVAPVAALISLLGCSVFTLTLFNLLNSLGAVAATAWLGRRLGGDGAGLVSGCLMAVVPSSIYCGTSLGPDEPGTFAMALSVAVWVAAMDATGRRATTLLVLSGACAGLGQTVREVCFFLFAFYAVEAILRRRWDAVVLPALGFAAVTGLEVATFWIFTGDPLYRIRAIRAAQREQMGNFITGADAAWYAPFWLIYSKRPSYGFHYIGFFIAAAALLYRRDRAAWPTLRWWAILFLLIGFWPARLQPYLRSIPSDFRFYEPLVAPAAVALGYALWKLRTWTFGVAVAAIGLFALASNVVLRRNVDTNGFSVKASYRRVREVRPALPVVADSETLAGFRFLSGYRDTIVAATEPKAEWDEFLLVLNEALLRGLKDLGQGDQGERLARLLETTPHEEISRDDTPRGSNYFTLFSGPKAVKTDGSVRVYRCRRG